MPAGTILLIDSSPQRRQLMRQALQDRGYVVSGEAGSPAELVIAAADLEEAPSTILIGAEMDDGGQATLARILKRTWPKATVLQETDPDEVRRNRLAITTAQGA